MPSLKPVSSSQAPEDFLRAALEAPNARERARLAKLGLEHEGELDADTHVLLLRQLYRAFLDAEQFRQAADVALAMTKVDGRLKDIAHHDASRALGALGDGEGAIAAQRLAARSSPPERRSFHYWCLGTLLHFAGDLDGAMAALRRGERWAHIDRPLLRAHRAWVQLEAHEPVRRLDAVLAELARSKARGGYGQLVLGMLHHAMGNHAMAAVHLRAFLRKNASADPAKVATLREELRRARAVLASIESD
jgi:hypothetical protein